MPRMYQCMHMIWIKYIYILIRARNGRLLGQKRLSIVLIKANEKYPNTGH